MVINPYASVPYTNLELALESVFHSLDFHHPDEYSEIYQKAAGKNKNLPYMIAALYTVKDTYILTQHSSDIKTISKTITHKAIREKHMNKTRVSNATLQTLHLQDHFLSA